MLQIHGAVLAENFTPTKLNDLRVREMTIASKDQKNVSFRIELETPADRLEHFWWDAKKRLVVDIYGAIGKDERDQTEVSQQVKTNQATTGSDSADTLQAIEPDKVVPSAPNTEPKVVKGDQRGGSSSEQVASSDKEGTSDAGITSVSPTVTKFSKGREGSSADTPEAVLEALIPSLAPEATDLLRRILMIRSQWNKLHLRHKTSVSLLSFRYEPLCFEINARFDEHLKCHQLVQLRVDAGAD